MMLSHSGRIAIRSLASQAPVLVPLGVGVCTRFMSTVSKDNNRQMSATATATFNDAEPLKASMMPKFLSNLQPKPEEFVSVSSHFKGSNSVHPLKNIIAPPLAFTAEFNPATAEFTHECVWSKEEVEGVKITHVEPADFADKAAFQAVKFLRWSFDWLAGFKTGDICEDKYLNRVIFLETVAAIPGMVAGTLRHLNSLRLMKRDHGWIATLLEEAENERMHLLTFLYLKKPGPIFRTSVTLTQGLIWNAFFFTYLVNPKICHRLVGYIEEEAVHTYTTLLNDIDSGKLPMFERLPAPAIAKEYWKLSDDALFRDLILAVRADEANHRIVNHTFADLHANFKENEINPFIVAEQVAKRGGFVEQPAIKETEVKGGNPF